MTKLCLLCERAPIWLGVNRYYCEECVHWMVAYKRHHPGTSDPELLKQAKQRLYLEHPNKQKKGGD